MSGGNNIYRIVLLTHSLDGGVWTVTRFLRDVLRRSGQYEVDIVFLATSARDPASVRLFSPITWVRGPQVFSGKANHIPYRHIGAVFTEFEFQRYQPRHILTELLNRYDLVQVVGGGPAWAFATHCCFRPIALQVASLSSRERASFFQTKRGVLQIWRLLMTKIVKNIEKRALHKVDAVFVENSWMHEVISQEIGTHKTVFAPPGIDTDYWKPTTYQPNGYILSVSRLSDRRKNMQMLLRAYHRLREVLPKALRLVLAGHAGLLPENWAYADSLDLVNHIEVHVNVSLEKLRTLYQNAALFVLSSNEEGWE